MAIRNSDGTPYRVKGSIQQFDPDNREFDLFNQYDQEIIEISGSPLYYYEVFINRNTIDELYVEDRGKLWSNCPVCIYGFYDPIPSQNFLGYMGIDSPNEMMFEFNYRHVLSTIGHAPKIGSRIFSPHKRQNWVIVQRNLGMFKLWGEFRLQVMCKQWQESYTTGEGKVTQKTPNFKINDIKDFGR